MRHPFWRRHYTPLVMVALNTVFAATFAAVALSGFHQPRPHGLPVGIVAPTRVTRATRRLLDERTPHGFAVRALPSVQVARDEITHRRVDGVLVVSRQGMTLLTAQAGGSAPTRAITTAFAPLVAKTGRRLNTNDVVAPLPSDSEGLSAFFLILCVLFPSLATGAAAGHALRRTAPSSRIAVLVLFAAAAGLSAAAIGDGISGLGHFWALAAIVALFSLAVSAPAAALGQIKPHLIGLCVLAFLILGIPASGGGANLAAFGPGFLRSLGCVLPLGVAVDTIRNTVYFHASDTTGHLWVLTTYATAGIAALCGLVTLDRRPDRKPVRTVAARGRFRAPHIPETTGHPRPASSARR
jgi:hypothetical protein